MASTQFNIIESYRGIDIVKVNHRNSESMYYGVIINGELSITALHSVQACKNVIDTYIRNHKEYCINDIPDSVGGGYKQV